MDPPKNINFNDFKQMCRFCLAKSQTKYPIELNKIFREDGSPVNETIMGTIRNYLGFEKISPFDGLPQSYCTKCQKALQTCSSFRRLCAISAQQLQSIVRDKLKQDSSTRKFKGRKSVVMELEIEQLDMEDEMIMEVEPRVPKNNNFSEEILLPHDDYFKIKHEQDDELEDIHLYQMFDNDDFAEDTSQTEEQSLDATESHATIQHSEAVEEEIKNVPGTGDNYADADDLNGYVIEDNHDQDEYYSVVYANDIEDNTLFKDEDAESEVGEIIETEIENGEVVEHHEQNENQDTKNDQIEVKEELEDEDLDEEYLPDRPPENSNSSKKSKRGGKKNSSKELCPDCGGFFIGLKNHMQTHRDKNIRKCYNCDKCDAKFVNKASFVGHVNKHNNLTPFQCPQCEKSFHGKGNLRMHMNSHSTVNKYACSECNKAFRYSHMLALHRRSHTLERVYFCEFCNYCSVNRENYKNHMMNHTGVYRFNCEKCLKGFKKKSYYTRHMQTHEI